MATQPVLATKTLPWPQDPDGYSYDYEFRGASRQMADGSLVIDLVQATAKHVFVLKWNGLTDTQLGDIEDAYDAIAAASASFTGLDGTTYTVMRNPEVKFQPTAHAIAGGKAIEWSASIGLREV
jgi:hypothetical protein